MFRLLVVGLDGLVDLPSVITEGKVLCVVLLPCTGTDGTAAIGRQEHLTQLVHVSVIVIDSSYACFNCLRFIFPFTNPQSHLITHHICHPAQSTPASN